MGAGHGNINKDLLDTQIFNRPVNGVPLDKKSWQPNFMLLGNVDLLFTMKQGTLIMHKAMSSVSFCLSVWKVTITINTGQRLCKPRLSHEDRLDFSPFG
jgi:hypothetical protein